MENKVGETDNLLPQFETYLRVTRGVSVSTYKHHIANLEMYFREYPSFDEKSFSLFLVSRMETKEAGTIANYIFTARVFCEYLKKEGVIAQNWAKKMKLPKRDKKLPNILEVNEIEAILSTDLPRSYSKYPNPTLAKENLTLILSLLAQTGARLSEVTHIRLSDIDWQKGIWRLDSSVVNHSKTRCGRLIPIPPPLLPRLDKLAQGKEPGDYLFTNPISGRVYSNGVVGNNFRMRLSRSGIRKEATVHTLRHSFITELMRQDVSILKIANIVGHENVKTTQGYAKLLYEDLQEAILRHPMTAKQRNPYDILSHIKKVIESFRLKEDTRFMFNIDDSNEGLRISIFIR